jgi:hypothetical protein
MLAVCYVLHRLFCFLKEKLESRTKKLESVHGAHSRRKSAASAPAEARMRAAQKPSSPANTEYGRRRRRCPTRIQQGRDEGPGPAESEPASVSDSDSAQQKLGTRPTPRLHCVVSSGRVGCGRAHRASHTSVRVAPGASNDTELEKLEERRQFAMHCIDCFAVRSRERIVGSFCRLLQEDRCSEAWLLHSAAFQRARHTSVRVAPVCGP